MGFKFGMEPHSNEGNSDMANFAVPSVEGMDSLSLCVFWIKMRKMGCQTWKKYTSTGKCVKAPWLKQASGAWGSVVAMSGNWLNCCLAEHTFLHHKAHSHSCVTD